VVCGVKADGNQSPEKRGRGPKKSADTPARKKKTPAKKKEKYLRFLIFFQFFWSTFS